MSTTLPRENLRWISLEPPRETGTSRTAIRSCERSPVDEQTEYCPTKPVPSSTSMWAPGSQGSNER